MRGAWKYVQVGEKVAHTHACTSHIQCSSSTAPVSNGEGRLCWQAWEVLMVIVGIGGGGMERHWWW